MRTCTTTLLLLALISSIGCGGVARVIGRAASGGARAGGGAARVAVRTPKPAFHAGAGFSDDAARAFGPKAATFGDDGIRPIGAAGLADDSLKPFPSAGAADDALGSIPKASVFGESGLPNAAARGAYVCKKNGTGNVLIENADLVLDVFSYHQDARDDPPKSLYLERFPYTIDVVKDAGPATTIDAKEGIQAARNNFDGYVFYGKDRKLLGFTARNAKTFKRDHFDELGRRIR